MQYLDPFHDAFDFSNPEEAAARIYEQDDRFEHLFASKILEAEEGDPGFSLRSALGLCLILEALRFEFPALNCHPEVALAWAERRRNPAPPKGLPPDMSPRHVFDLSSHEGNVYSPEARTRRLEESGLTAKKLWRLAVAYRAERIAAKDFYESEWLSSLLSFVKWTVQSRIDRAPGSSQYADWGPLGLRIGDRLVHGPTGYIYVVSSHNEGSGSGGRLVRDDRWPWRGLMDLPYIARRLPGWVDGIEPFTLFSFKGKTLAKRFEELDLSKPSANIIGGR